MSKAALALLCFIAAAPPAVAQPPAPDPWSAVRFLVGEWRGTIDGEQGKGTVTRRFRFILSSRFLQDRSVYDFPPQPLHPNGSVTSHASFMMQDSSQNLLMYRQRHLEHLNGTFVLSKSLSGPAKLVFELEPPKDAAGTLRVRETWERVSPDEYVEVLESSQDGKPFTVHGRIQFKRRPS